jgi:CRP-like cAMP-binding protein
MTEFLQSVRLFKNMPLKSLQAAIPVFKEVRFDYNRILYRLNEPPKGIYIVKSGQFDLIVP